MSKEKSLFEQLGGTYTEGEDGLLYPNIAMNEEDTSHMPSRAKISQSRLSPYKDNAALTDLNASIQSVNADYPCMACSLRGKYGDIWKNYLKENHPDRYCHLVRLGELQKQALEVNEEANEMLDIIMNQYLKSHKPVNPSSTMEQWKLREQAKQTAEEVVFHDIVYRFY